MKEHLGKLVVAELDHFQRHFKPDRHQELYLKDEPFVAAAVTTNGKGEKQTLLICRAWIPGNLEPATAGATYASYLAPLGQIVAKRPGEHHQFSIPWSKTQWDHHDHHLDAKAEFTPELVVGHWDGINARIEWLDGRVATPSLRRLLSELDTAGIPGETVPSSDGFARVITLKVELPAQAILDSVQDEIFRQPFNSRVRISGAPGTGKTTVLIKRLSQKTKQEFLTEGEKVLFSVGEWREQDWMLFSPSDLLKGYLEKALAKERLQAEDEHVKVYGTFRREILRELGVIKVINSGFFKALSEGVQTLKRQQSKEYKRLADSFGSYLEEVFEESFEGAFRKFNDDARREIRDLSRQNEELLKKALDLIAEAGDDVIKLRDAQKRTPQLREANAEVGRVLKVISGISESQSTASGVGPLRMYSMHRRLNNEAARIGDNLPDAVPEDMTSLVSRLRSHIRTLADSLSISEMLKIIPRAYADFRRVPANTKRYFNDNAAEHFGRQSVAISGPEQDLLLLHILDLVRKLWSEMPADRNGVPEKVVNLMERMRTNICIDEVTDFSPLEIACMERFAHPRRGGVTICGDLMQRVTQDGIVSWDELEDLSPGFEPCELKIGYRQTASLFEIARQLHSSVTGLENPDFRSAYDARESDPPALIHKVGGSNENSAKWLSDRIGEIFEICGERLPSIAILVPTPSDVSILSSALTPLLEEMAIEVDASHDGGKLGNPSRVRIFPVEAIKGLEFEAVFYVGIDKMAEVHKDLIDKYLYVGLSRARNFLGVSFVRSFPKRLECIRPLFKEQESFSSSLSELNAAKT